MALVTRRRFVHQTAIATAALYGRPMKLLGGGRQIFGEREQNAAPIDAATIRKLASQISGHVITPEAPDYEASRVVGNRAYDRHPALIVRCTGASDITRALDFGQSQGLSMAVRGGGHSAAGFGVCDGCPPQKFRLSFESSPLRTDRSPMEGLGLPILYISSSVKERP
jgi:hypothetical protein